MAAHQIRFIIGLLFPVNIYYAMILIDNNTIFCIFKGVFFISNKKCPLAGEKSVGKSNLQQPILVHGSTLCLSKEMILNTILEKFLMGFQKP